MPHVDPHPALVVALIMAPYFIGFVILLKLIMIALRVIEKLRAQENKPMMDMTADLDHIEDALNQH